MNKYKVEYLSVINSKENFCKSISSLNSLLQSHDSIEISGNSINFAENSFGYDVQYGEIQEDTQRFFHVKLTCNNKKDIEPFKQLLKSVRSLLSKASEKPPEILWDDLSSEFANKSYPIVHEIENLMRKLITKFMLTNIGLGWTKDTVPKEVSESIKTKKNIHPQNYLYEADFIQLSNFLFKEYSTANSRKLVEKLGAASDITDLDLSELKQLVPQSNWERYFSPIVDCKSEYLQTRWEKLYDLRCMVAHNKFIGKDEYDNIISLSSDVKEKLTQAIKNLDKVHVSEEQKEDVAENIASNMNSLYGEFLQNWKILNELLLHLFTLYVQDYPSYSKKYKTASIKSILVFLVEKGIIDKKNFHLIIELNHFRNTIVHSPNLTISKLELHNFINTIDVIKHEIIIIIEDYGVINNS